MFLGRFRHWVFRRYRNSTIKKHKLDYLFWECTLKCNLNCLHCGSDCLKTSGIPDMPIEDFLKVLDEIKSSGITKLTVCITGGEPLLRSDLEKAGFEIIKRGFSWGIVTNGMFLTEKRFFSLLSAGMGSMSFSLDGLESEHTYLRQNPSSFQKTIDGIKMAVVFKKRNPSRFVFDVITCVHPKNLSILPKLRDFLLDLGVTRWRIFSIYPQGRAGENDLSLNHEQYVELMNFIAETRKYEREDGLKIHLNYSCEGYLGDWELKVRDFFFFCRGGISVGSVMCDGSIGACLSVRGKDFIQGNIYKDNFMDVWQNRYQNMRNRDWAKHGKCKNCHHWKKCLGNGMHLHPDEKSDVFHCNLELLQKSNNN